MAISDVQKALISFATSQGNSAIVLKGKWGTGKTFLWEKVVAEHKTNFSKESYSYVSLFGVGSLADLRREIFENKLPKQDADKLPSSITALNNVDDFMKSGSKIFNALKEIPAIKGLGGVVEKIQYNYIDDCIICLDDYERKGNGLSAKDILGFVSSLVEKKNCKVILLLNSDALHEKDEYFEYHEKVFQRQVAFKPTADEASDTVFRSDDIFERKLSFFCKALNITNIRILKKAADLLSILRPTLTSAEPEILEKTAQTLALSVQSLYSDQDRIPINFIYAYDNSQYRTKPIIDESESARVEREKANAWIKFLVNYGYLKTTKFDRLIIDFVQDGYANSTAFAVVVSELTAMIQHDTDIANLNSAWSKVTSSFDDDVDAVLSAFDKALPACLDKMSPTDISEVVKLFRVISIDRAEKWTTNYFEYLSATKPFVHKNQLHRWPDDIEISQKLSEYFAAQVEVKNFDQLIDLGQDFLTPDRCEQISKKSDQEYFIYLQRLKGLELHAVASKLLEVERLSSSNIIDDNTYAAIFFKTYEALVEIGKTSDLNSFRVRLIIDKYKKRYDSKKLEMTLKNDEIQLFIEKGTSAEYPLA